MTRVGARLSKRFMADRSRHSPEGDHNSNWAISYGDMITLLLAFFVLFFSVDKGKRDIQLLGKIVNEEMNRDSTALPVESTWGVKDKEKDQSDVYAGIQKNMKDAFSVKTSVMGNKLIVEFPQTSFFESANFELTGPGRQALAQFAGIFKRFSGSMRLIVRGYTDNQPVRAGVQKFSDNLELSALRAISALRVLSEFGVPFDMMRIGGYGETDKSRNLSEIELMKFDRKIVLVVEPLDATERGVSGKDWSRIPAGKRPGKTPNLGWGSGSASGMPENEFDTTGIEDEP